MIFARDGSAGVLYYSALLRYAPLELPVTPLDRGMVVQRWFEPSDGGGQSRKFLAGDLVRVRLRVATPQQRRYVVVEVPLPSGLEPVDPSLNSSPRLSEITRDRPHRRGGGGEGEGDEEGEGGEGEWTEDSGEGGSSEPGGYYRTAFYDPFNHREMRDDRVLFFSDNLPPGIHVATFMARATTMGTFVLRPAHAEEMYTPEVFGRSDGGSFEIVEK